MRWIAPLFALLLLGACNSVASKDALFTAADAVGAPPLRDGVWVENDGCRFNVRKPVQNWPECASWFVVRGGELLRWEDDAGDKTRVWSPQPFLLASGDPRIMQVQYPPSEDPNTKAMVDEGYGYLAIAPTALDAEGRIVGVRRWLVECGPLPPSDDKDKSKIRVDSQTLEPFPGLVLTKGGGCLADKAEAVRGAAAASRSFAEPVDARWVRDTLP
jgi:hypothetical protein